MALWCTSVLLHAWTAPLGFVFDFIVNVDTFKVYMLLFAILTTREFNAVEGTTTTVSDSFLLRTFLRLEPQRISGLAIDFCDLRSINFTFLQRSSFCEFSSDIFWLLGDCSAVCSLVFLLFQFLFLLFLLQNYVYHLFEMHFLLIL